MKVISEGNLISVELAPDFTDKDSGEVKVGKHKLDLLVKSELKNGSFTHDILHISIPSEKVAEYKTQIGKPIQVKCDYIAKGNVSFFVRS